MYSKVRAWRLATSHRLPTFRGNDARRSSAAVPGVPMPASTAPVAHPASSRKEPSRLQQLIARRMAEAKATVPHFQVQTEVAMDAAIKLRAELRALAGEGDPVPSLNDIIIKAAAMALREHPLANGSYQNDGFVLHDRGQRRHGRRGRRGARRADRVRR